MIGKVVTAGTTFLVTIIVARAFGLDGFGEYIKIFSFVTLFYLVVDFGLNAMVLQNSSTEESGIDAIRDIMGLRILLAALAMFAALAITIFLPYDEIAHVGFSPEAKLGIVVLVPTILGQALFVTANALFQKKLRYDLSVVASSAGSITTLALVYLLVQFKAPLVFTVVAYPAGSAVMAASALFLAGWPNFFGQIRWKEWRILFISGIPLGLTLLFNLIYFRADAIILSLYRSSAEVGIYGLAYRFFEFPLVLPTFFMNAFYPVLLMKKKENAQDLHRLIKKAFLLLLAASLVIIVVGWIFAPYFTLVSPAFTKSIDPFHVLLLSLPFFFLSSLCMWVMITLKRTVLLTTIYAFAMLINIVLNLFLIPRFGYMAAAYTTFLSEGIVLFLTFYGSKLPVPSEKTLE